MVLSAAEKTARCRARRRAAGLCWFCTRRTMQGRSLCEVHHASQLSRSERRALRHLRECGGWLPEDPVRVRDVTLHALEARGLVRLEMRHGTIVSATLAARSEGGG